jgi:hypothetical protein
MCLVTNQQTNTTTLNVTKKCMLINNNVVGLDCIGLYVVCNNNLDLDDVDIFETYTHQIHKYNWYGNSLARKQLGILIW